MLDAGFGNKSISITQRRYLGSKTRLLSFIDSILEKEKVSFRSFADIFAGTGVVADYFYERADVIVNDILESNYQCYLAFFGKERIRTNWLNNKLNEYNKIDIENARDNYFSINFSNTYFDSLNSKRIGIIREDIEQMYKNKEINKRERAYLITSLIYALDRIANTVGHYDAYRKIKIPLKILELRPLAIRKNNKNKSFIYKRDATELVGELSADVVYIDPPYNSRQYSDAYHLLENIASWEKKEVHGVARKIERSHLKSDYCLKSAGSAFGKLISNINAKFILVSYNDMGTNGNARSQSRISDHELMSALERIGRVTIYEKPFNQFTTGVSTNDNLKERVFFCRVGKNKDLRPSIPKSESGSNTHLPPYVKSPLNYTGGKHKLLPQINRLFPKNIRTFYDVFCGGANVGINAIANQIICVDNNPHVIDLLNIIQKSNFEDLNQRIVRIIEQHGLSQSYINGYDKYNSQSSDGLGHYNKEPFIKLRNLYNSIKEKTEEKTLLLLVLIFYGFNNQIRFNSQGQFNLPVGKRDYNGSSRRNLAQFNAITNLKNISFTKGDFRHLDKLNLLKEDFLYFDPPYLLGLASYNESGGWSLYDEEDLYKTLLSLNRKGIRFALSNVIEHKGKKNIGLIELAKKNNFTVNPIIHDYKNSNYQSTAKDNKTREVLITNY